MNAKPEIIAPPESKIESQATQSIQSIISKHPFLEGMNPHQLQILGDCAMLANFRAGEEIFCAGDPANRFYLILKGRVALESYVKDKGSTLIQTIGAGDVLGWSWLFPPYFWHFNARALEPTDAVFIYATPLRDECEFDHELGYELMKRMAEVMMRRLQATRKQLLGLPWLLRPNQTPFETGKGAT